MNLTRDDEAEDRRELQQKFRRASLWFGGLLLLALGLWTAAAVCALKGMWPPALVVAVLGTVSALLALCVFVRLEELNGLLNTARRPEEGNSHIKTKS